MEGEHRRNKTVGLVAQCQGGKAQGSGPSDAVSLKPHSPEGGRGVPPASVLYPALGVQDTGVFKKQNNRILNLNPKDCPTLPPPALFFFFKQ